MTLRDVFQALGWGVVHSAWLLTVVWAVWRARLTGADSAARHRFAALALIACCAAHVVSVGAGGFLPLMRPEAAAGAFTYDRALGDAVAAPLVVSPAAQWYVADLVLIIGVVWAASTAVGLLRLAGGIVLARSRYLHRCRPASPAWRALVLDVAARRGIHTRIRVLESPMVGSPAMLGVLRPAIVLPAGGLEHLTPAQRRGVV
ncbi:MAG: hypothetical protein M3Y31_04065, partial [Gemmatimonadota bacterium]|nr:hypothetical protein [Gemmatimonadota bacterium]